MFVDSQSFHYFWVSVDVYYYDYQFLWAALRGLQHSKGPPRRKILTCKRASQILVPPDTRLCEIGCKPRWLHVGGNVTLSACFLLLTSYRRRFLFTRRNANFRATAVLSRTGSYIIPRLATDRLTVCVRTKWTRVFHSNIRLKLFTTVSNSIVE